MPRSPSPRTLFRRLAQDARGNVGLIFGLSLVMLALVAGAAVDFTRASQFKSMLQGTVDAAALAGASSYVSSTTATTGTTVATTYMNNGIPLLPTNNGVTFSVSTGSVTSGSQTTGYTVTISATAQVPTTLMGIFTRSIAVTVGAKAEDPVVTATADFTGWSSSACDGNTIYWYLIPTNGGLPPLSSLNQLYTNVTGASNTAVNNFSVPAGQKVGFALQNVTGENCAYGSNQYGASQGSTQYFYSQLTPPSADAYSSVTQDCSLQVIAVTNGVNPTPVSGSCFATDPQNSTTSCQSLSGQTMRYFWNDMGGATDDKDYNDAEYNFSCAGGSGSTTGVYVVQ
jgi:Flp pilus assembly protein TadG